ncbi:cytochrome c biogenesis protein ResB [Trichlorobacter sp.]|uniref:cytochrome c biogenesis protein ResB n=1 Tax=Trichlorobacter sp. TaxID=2911007 RepID=UPI002A35D291|nr:cytochrome c biogenesis protein ResB [Trichlorobacter sp.]MDY0384791.1 cytochrome c biogenesis protein ResB [Trichlorobacter sp.]
MSEPQRDIPTRIWDALASLRLTMFLLIALALVSIIGTVIPQGALDPQYIAAIGGEQGNRFKLYSLLGFFNMYHSWWFLGLLGLLSANLLACSLKRLPQVWRIAFRPEPLLTAGVERSATCCQTLPLGSTTDPDRLAGLLATKLGRPVINQQDGQTHLFAQRRPWARLAAYLVHFSIILIFIGAIIGNLFGFKGFVAIPEGETVTSFTDRQGNVRPLGFELRCDQFTVSYYPAQGGHNPMPKEFKSILTLTENGREVPGYKHARLIVNEPLTYRGITFYQSSYGTTGSHQLRIGEGPQGQTLQLASDGTAHLPDGSSMHVVEAVQDVSPFLAGKTGPAARIDIHPASGGAPLDLIVFANHPDDNRAEAARLGLPVISYLGGTERFYTGLQVNKDPGVWVVWAGCLLLCVALYVAFFMPHQRVWMRIDNHQLTIAGHTTRGHEQFRQWFNALIADLQPTDTQEDNQ